MKVELFGKAGCAICAAAEEKLGLLKVKFFKRNAQRYLDHHEGWKIDGSLEFSSAYFMMDQKLPILKIDGEFFNYPGGMRRLKNGREQRKG